MPLISSFASGSSRGLGAFSVSALYAFSSHTFTSGPVTTGRNGPTLGQLQTAYSSQPWAQNTSFLNMTTQGIQLWTVPEDAIYQFTVAGARGATGAVGTAAGGSGAILNGRVFLTRGTILSIVVGQIGIDGGSGRGGGGGGGSFVYTGAIGSNGLIIAAGGGGGGDDAAGGTGQSCSIDLQPRATNGVITANSGLAGVGGYSDGAGWLSEGSTYAGTFDGQRWIGGQGNAIGEGGFGGAGGDIDDGGSGGGFTGGSGTTAAGGGAGGSFYAGMSEPDTTYTSIYTVQNYSWGGNNSGNGYVTVTKL